MDHRHPPDAAFPRGLRRETFGRYGLLALLGQGGMGRLYLAERRGIQGFVKIVALKQILPHLADSQHLREMFLNEARIAAKLEHPNIVATYELGEVEGKYFISMEYLPGEDFSAIIARCQADRRIPIEIATALAQQAAQGLHHAHEARDEGGRLIGLVHRDVNPRNLFLTYHGAVKVLDFGVVRGREGPRTNPGAFKGKYGYCAPEQIEGGQVDRRTDVFCLGIVLWECLTGARLFDGSNDAQTIDAVRSRHVEPPSALRPEIPPALDAIVRRALERDPARRFQSAHDLSEELDAFLLERDMRPTTKSVGRWLESMFGADRASLKKAISQGASVEGTLERLAALEINGAAPANGPITARRVTTLGGAATPPPGAEGSAPPRRSNLPRHGATTVVMAAAALIGAAAVLVTVAGAPNGDGAARSAKVRATGGLVVTSEPSGAHVFVDGSPSGLKTPTVLEGLAPGSQISLRLDKDGYVPRDKQLQIQEGPPRKVSFTLAPLTGTVKLTGAPARAIAYLDDRVVELGRPVPTPAGRHRLRLEVDQTVLISKTVEVTAGAETTLDVATERSGP
jgi:serine/threonine protein kinase